MPQPNATAWLDCALPQCVASCISGCENPRPRSTIPKSTDTDTDLDVIARVLDNHGIANSALVAQRVRLALISRQARELARELNRGYAEGIYRNDDD